MHTAKRFIAYLFSFEAVGNFCESRCFTPDPRPRWMHAPLNYPFSNLCSGKPPKDVIDYVKDTISLSYEIGTVPVFTQTPLTYVYKERIVHHGHAYKSIDAQSFAEAPHATRLREKILNKILKVGDRSPLQ